MSSSSLFESDLLLTGSLLSLPRLGDADDDVRSVSAACLLPVATYLATRLPEELARVVAVLWDALSEGGDELGSSTGGVMDLLGEFSPLSHPRLLWI